MVLTIGHSNHSLDTFLKLLRQNGVSAVADVRSVPFSRAQPHYNRDALKASLRDIGIKYAFLGKELGGRTTDDSCYEDGRVVYQRLARTPAFRSGLQRVVRGAATHRLALLCAERDPLDCHRALLIARELENQGVPVAHILPRGQLEPHRTTIRRLLEETGIVHDDLFLREEQTLALAYERQERRIAYIRRSYDG